MQREVKTNFKLKSSVTLTPKINMEQLASVAKATLGRG